MLRVNDYDLDPGKPPKLFTKVYKVEDYEYKDVNDILPLKYDSYLVKTEFGVYTIMLYDYQGWDSISKGKPTHWMHIPKVKEKKHYEHR